MVKSLIGLTDAKQSTCLGVELKAKVYHKEGGTIGTANAILKTNGSPKSEFYQAKSKLMLAYKHNKIFIPTVFLFLILRSVKFFLKGENDLAVPILKACLMSNRFE